MLIDTVRQTIRDHDLIHRGDHIVLGLSGGPDSTCLFHVLRRLAGEMELTIHPVHVNHMFRPGDADRDQVYVENLCMNAAESEEDSAVRPCRTFVVDCNALAKELGMTSEEAGRKARYDAFVQVAEEVAEEVSEESLRSGSAETRCEQDPAETRHEQGSARVRIAVAQNANDQAETILHRILRGTGTDGLSGIAYERSERGIPVIRPILDVPRTEIEAYCEENGLDPVIDYTNKEPIYTRNRIRLDLLPALEAYNENIVASLTRLGRIATADREYLWQQAERAYRELRAESAGPAESAGAGELETVVIPDSNTPDHVAPSSVILDRAGLAAQPPAIRHRIIARAFSEIGLASDITEERLRAADAIIGKKQAPKTVQFPRGYLLTVRQGRVVFSGQNKEGN